MTAFCWFAFAGLVFLFTDKLTSDYTPSSGIHVCWFEHSNLSLCNGSMTLSFGIGTLNKTPYLQ